MIHAQAWSPETLKRHATDHNGERIIRIKIGRQQVHDVRSTFPRAKDREPLYREGSTPNVVTLRPPALKPKT